MPKERESYECLSLIMLESVIKRKKYYPQTLLEECKYEIKKQKKMENLIDDDFDPGSSDEFDNEESNLPEYEEFNGSDNDESNYSFVNDKSNDKFNDELKVKTVF